MSSKHKRNHAGAVGELEKTAETKTLSLAERIAVTATIRELQALQADLEAARKRMAQLLESMGLDSKKVYNLSPQGEMVEVKADAKP